ncbi:MAG TPA: hypothetical protein VHF47_07585 [Acidimicrobiales bacterium]|nr:hypothetical protein [Acidimicrobiales bacterium]
MRRVLVIAALVGTALVVPASRAEALEADTLTCAGEYPAIVLHGGYATAGPFDIHCWRVEASPLAVTPLVTGSARLEVFNNGLCTLGRGWGTVHVSFNTTTFQESYRGDFLMAVLNGVAQIVINDGTSSDGADSAEGTGEVSELPCCPIFVCNDVKSEIKFEAVFFEAL